MGEAGRKGRVDWLWTAAIVVALLCVFYVIVVVVYLGTVPIPRQGWRYFGSEGGLRPVSGQWLGFRVGQSRSGALANACRLVAAGELTALRFECPREKTRPVGIVSGATGEATSEAWTFAPHLMPWELHCLGLSGEELTVWVEGGRVDEFYVSCGVIDF